MKEKVKDESSELIVICGVLILLGVCVIAEILGAQGNTNVIVQSLVIVLTGAAGHAAGKNAGLAKPKEQNEQPKQEETS